MKDASDAELIRQWLEGRNSAFDELYRRYRLQLYSYLGRLLPGQSALVDDLYQQTWVRVVDRLARYTEKERFLPWLMRIGHNLAMDHFRQQARRKHVELHEAIAGEEDEPWQGLDQAAIQEGLQRALESLPEDQREVVLLRQQGVSFKEIAAIQGTGVNTVLGRMHYAMGKLQKQLLELR